MSKSNPRRIAQKAQEAKSTKQVVREYAWAIVLAVIVALFVRASVVQAYEIPSGSMLNTLQIGDQTLVNRFVYGLKIPFTEKIVLPLNEPQRGDIVVFEPPFKSPHPYIKRVVGLPGDRVAIVDKKVFVNGQPLDEPYVRFTDRAVLPANVEQRDNFGPITVPEGKLFVMGDNRDESYDSRVWGYADIKKVKGKAFIIHWSWDNQKPGVRWDRLLKWVL